VARLIRVRAGPVHFRHVGSCSRVTAARSRSWRH